MLILGIETSCDETAAAVVLGPDFVKAKAYKNGQIGVRVLSNVVSSQIEIHKKYGGVVPEVAAREHVLNILPVINEALEKAGIKKEDAPKKIDAIAVTVGPGLVTSLIVGIETAKTLSAVWKIPVIGINHIEGHICANFIRENSKMLASASRRSEQEADVKNIFPAVVMTVSGGHNMLFLMKGYDKIKLLGETLDDAAGEAFDKAAQMLGLGYPGGPAISAWAEKLKVKNEKLKINLPRPMLNKKNYDFSFSGLKTALMYKIKSDKKWKERIPEYAAEFQTAVIDVLAGKTIRASGEFKAKTVILAGGVSANKELRMRMEKAVKEKLKEVDFNMPDLKYTTDNAAMIAAAGYFRAQKKKFTPWQKLKVDANLEL